VTKEYKEIINTAVKIYFSNNISAKEAIERAKNIVAGGNLYASR